jgi:hypothetical protein
MAAGELIMRCFHARTAAHILHLKTRSYAAHKALNDFYDAIVPLTDAFAEAYQGDYGLIEDYPARYTPYAVPLDMVTDLSDWISAHRKDCCDEDDSYLQNIIDEIVALLRSTEYKLRFLK